MGSPKQVLTYGDTTMVGAVVDTARRSRVADVIVVTGFHGEQVEPAVGSRARIVHNANAVSGNMSSLVVGLDAVAGTDGVIVLLSDMPQVTPDVIDTLIDAMSEHGERAGWIEYSDGPGHPVALAAASFDEVRHLRGPKALWRYLEALESSDVAVAKVETPKPTDVNTQEDYERVTRSVPTREQGCHRD